MEWRALDFDFLMKLCFGWLEIENQSNVKNDQYQFNHKFQDF